MKNREEIYAQAAIVEQLARDLEGKHTLRTWQTLPGGYLGSIIGFAGGCGLAMGHWPWNLIGLPFLVVGGWLTWRWCAAVRNLSRKKRELEEASAAFARACHKH